MKNLALALVTGLALLPSGQAQEMRDAPTHEQMALRLRAQRNQDPMRDLKVIEADDPTKTNRPADILATSEFLSFSGASTLVPQGAVLHVPDSLRNRTGIVSGNRIVTWAQFFAENRAWIEVVDLELSQIIGAEPLPAGLISRMENSRQIMVAAVQGGPISVPQAKLDEAKALAEARK
ncbi:hypothetical protein [Haloferula sargassicola]|uniref:Uncharacterized protein n=1 Tax=Haloferula sargassicola TaxID=490096 RepID=A0ABP9UUZ2_9BACT